MIGPSTADRPMTGPKTAKAEPCSSGAKTLADDPEALGDEQGGRRALGQPAADEHARVDGERRTPPRRRRSPSAPITNSRLRP